MINNEIDDAIKCQQLSVHYDSATVLHNINLSIPRGAVVGLIGANGAGKSTLLRCLVGLTAPSEGEASLLGCPSMTLSDDVRAKLGYVAQTPDLFEWMSVYDHLKMIGRAYPNWNEERCMVLAVRMNLPLGRAVSKLSGGDQQKLAVVLALAHDPDVLILDEPVSSLDPMARRNFMRSLFIEDKSNSDELDTATGPTIIISSHLLSDLERVVSHVAFLRDGELQLFEQWDTILEHVRLIPRETPDVPVAAILYQSRTQRVIDTRLFDGWIEQGKGLSLDELFVALNS